jgi:hypothetical protein
MKFREPDLQGLSLEELKIRNGLEAEAAQDRETRRMRDGAGAAGAAAVGRPVVTR